MVRNVGQSGQKKCKKVYFPSLQGPTDVSIISLLVQILIFHATNIEIHESQNHNLILAISYRRIIDVPFQYSSRKRFRRSAISFEFLVLEIEFFVHADVWPMVRHIYNRKFRKNSFRGQSWRVFAIFIFHNFFLQLGIHHRTAFK